MKALATTICNAALGLLCLCAAGSAAAQSTWNLSASTCGPVGAAAGNTAGCTVGGVTATVTGWATTYNATDSLLRQATLTDQGSSGIGITSVGDGRGPRQQAIDGNRKKELVLINFGTDKVNLTGLVTGSSLHDTDVSVLRWDGGLAGPDLATMSLTGATTGLTSSGWSMVSSTDLDGSVDNTWGNFGALSASINGGGSSSWWIISAYFGPNTGGLSVDDDYFMLLSFSGNCTSNVNGGECGTTEMPEPGSLALAAVALAGLGLRRRRSRA